MKFATTYPLTAHPYHPELVSPDGIARVSQAAEAAGFNGIGFTDHPAPSQRWLESGGHDALDPFVAMAFVAAATSTIRLIPNIVVLPYRNPFIVAKAGATLDLLSGGRFTMSVGAGYLKSEFSALGVDHSERNELFDEAIDVLRAIWTSDNVSFEGRHFSARGITGRPRPATCPPIWIGGNSSAARRRVAQRGDGWAPFLTAAPLLAQTARTAPMATPDDLAVALRDLRTRVERAGRSMDELDIMFACEAGGNPASDDFDADEHIDGLHALAELGVTWAHIAVPGDDIHRTLDTLTKYGEVVVSRVA